MAAKFEDVCGETFGFSKLKEFQADAIEQLLKGRDVFLSVKTGGGKSICYQAFQPLWEYHHRENNEKCIVVIISPLISIMKEQCTYLSSLGFSATYIGKNPEEDDDILGGHFQFLFASPGAILSIPKWRMMISSSQNIRLFVVDEAHIILHWGESDTKAATDPFRVWYGKLGEVRSLIECPVLMITATANNAARKEMERKFCMADCHEIIENPERENVKLFIHQFKSTLPLLDLFYFLLSLLEEKQDKCPRYLIFCTSIRTCSQIYTLFRMELGFNIKNVEMYHSKTTESVKENIKSDMSVVDGDIRILVATSAAGMGVNFKGVDNVINFGPPKDMDGFVQQIGRAGRDGSEAMAMLFFSARQCRNLDNDMKIYIQNKDKCRTECVLSAYKAKPCNRIKHLCCDICDKKCECGDGKCKTFQHPYHTILLPELSSDSENSDIDFHSDVFSEETFD